MSAIVQDVNVKIPMTQEECVSLVRRLFKQEEAIFLIHAAAQVIAQVARNFEEFGYPDGIPKDCYDVMTQTHHNALAKLMIAIPPMTLVGVKQSVFESFNVQIDEVFTTTPADQNPVMNQVVH